MRDFIHDQRGSLPVGLVAMILLSITFAMLWIATIPAVAMVWDVVNPYLPTEAAGPMSMLNNVFGWSLIVMVVGSIVYGAAWALKRDPVEYPA